MAKGGYLYMVSNKTRSVIYTGVTSSLRDRAWQHRNGEGSTFTKRYKCKYLIYYEFYETIEAAIEREKQIKKWKREYKENVISRMNPSWDDLYDQVGEMD